MDVMRGPSLLNDGDGDDDEQHSNVLRDTCKRILYSLAGCMHVGGDIIAMMSDIPVPYGTHI